MASEDVGEKDMPPVVPIHGLKELLKESLTEILRENPSLLQTEQSRGKCVYSHPGGLELRGQAPEPGRSGGGRWWPQYVWPGVTGGVWASPAWSGRWSGAVAVAVAPTVRSGVLSYIPLLPASPSFSPSFLPLLPLVFVTPCNGLQAHWVMPDGDQVESMGLYTLQQEETLIGSDEGTSALGLAIAEQSVDGGGADGRHLGRGKLENPKKSETSKKGEATARPFILSEGLPPHSC